MKAGAGLIAVESETPIVPVKIRITGCRHRPAAAAGVAPGDVELIIGEPIRFDAGTDHAAATTRLEAAVAAL